MGLIEDAGAVESEEPDWRERFEEHCARWLKLPRYLAEDNAFEATLKAWRRFHFVLVAKDNKPVKTPAPASAGVIALAKLNIMPPRRLGADTPRTDETGFQSDDHCWLSIAGEQWHIRGVEDCMLVLERLEPKEEKQIDLSRAKWGKYIESAVDVLRGL